MHEHCIEDHTRILLLGEKEGDNGAITCGEVGRVIIELTIGTNLDLRRSSRKIAATMMIPRTQVLPGGQVSWSVGAALVAVGFTPAVLS
jgi:hypothetical protein